MYEGDATDQAALVDREMLRALRDALGGGVDMLVDKAGQVVEDRLRSLSELDPVGDPEACARIAHEIGGVSGQIGLKRLSQQALAFEHRLRGGETDGARETIAAIGDTARNSLAEIRAV
ncbi:MAG: Hpt domain-containing protein [Rubrimonas sp.]|uniref:Hpt domain-containing protein n=1 Tax=Rubrimonas sp. TaxID=2036015 RepID=UPI002FDE479E